MRNGESTESKEKNELESINTSDGSSIESLKRNFSKKIICNNNSLENSKKTTQVNTLETIEKNINDDIEINNTIQREVLIEFVSKNLVEILIIEQENINFYDFDNKFYDGYFKLFSSSELIKTSKNHSKKRIKKINKEQVLNNMVIFINDIVNKLESETSTIIIAMIYLKRILSEQKLFISLDTVLNVFYILLILSHKYNEDLIYSSKVMSSIIEVPVSSFHKMELFLCHLLDHRLFVKEEEFENDLTFIIQNITYYT